MLRYGFALPANVSLGMQQHHYFKALTCTKLTKGQATTEEGKKRCCDNTDGTVYTEHFHMHDFKCSSKWEDKYYYL